MIFSILLRSPRCWTPTGPAPTRPRSCRPWRPADRRGDQRLPQLPGIPAHRQDDHLGREPESGERRGRDGRGDTASGTHEPSMTTAALSLDATAPSAAPSPVPDGQLEVSRCPDVSTRGNKPHQTSPLAPLRGLTWISHQLRSGFHTSCCRPILSIGAEASATHPAQGDRLCGGDFSPGPEGQPAWAVR
jgi:hypothetical protein